MMLSTLLAVFLWSCLLAVKAQDELLVCKPARNLFLGGEVGTVRENLRLAQGPSGKRGPKGERGYPGPVGPKGDKGSGADYSLIQQYIDEHSRPFFNSCLSIKQHITGAKSGLYDIKDSKGSIYRTYCDMSIGGGGWTLIASIHENNIAGKCTIGDRWSSEHGNSAAHPHGDGAWENTAIFGAPESAASDDYKNPGYFNMAARDMMIWHVPNRTPMDMYGNRAFMMYHTTTGFLGKFGGNLYNLYNDHYPLKSGTYSKTIGNGPVVPIVWDKGSNDLMVRNTIPNARSETTPGFIQFRAINHEGGAHAICPGVKVNDQAGNVEHYCIGGTSNQGHVNYCGDFSAYNWNGYATDTEWSANRAMTESVVMLFYR